MCVCVCVLDLPVSLNDGFLFRRNSLSLFGRKKFLLMFFLRFDLLQNDIARKSKRLNHCTKGALSRANFCCKFRNVFQNIRSMSTKNCDP